MEREKIQFAAIKRPDNCIIYGKDHGECMMRSPVELCGKNCIQGFLTNTFRFVEIIIQHIKHGGLSWRFPIS